MKTNADKRKFLEELEKTPIIFHASKKVGIDKATIYRWKEKDKKFAKQMEDALSIGRSGLCDIGEAQLAKLMNQGDFKAIKFYLENNEKRYIKPRNITIINTKNQSNVLTQEQMDKLDSLLEDSN